MDEFAADDWCNEVLQYFHFDATRPIARLDLHKHNILRSDADNVPRAKAGRRPRASVPGRLQHSHTAMFVMRPLPLQFMP